MTSEELRAVLVRVPELRERVICVSGEEVEMLLNAIEHLAQESASLSRTIKFNSDLYLSEHGGSWGTCKYKAENAELRAAVLDLVDEVNQSDMVDGVEAVLFKHAATIAKCREGK